MKIAATEMRGAKLWPGGCREEGGLLPPWGVGAGISKIRGLVTSLLAILSRRKPKKDARSLKLIENEMPAAASWCLRMGREGVAVCQPEGSRSHGGREKLAEREAKP